MDELLRLHLHELRSRSADECDAVFESDAGERFETTFTVDRRDGITTARDDPSLMSRLDGSAEDVQRIIHALVAFCDAHL